MVAHTSFKLNLSNHIRCLVQNLIGHLKQTLFRINSRKRDPILVTLSHGVLLAHGRGAPNFLMQELPSDIV